jgi:hypothetical protein
MTAISNAVAKSATFAMTGTVLTGALLFGVSLLRFGAVQLAQLHIGS